MQFYSRQGIELGLQLIGGEEQIRGGQHRTFPVALALTLLQASAAGS